LLVGVGMMANKRGILSGWFTFDKNPLYKKLHFNGKGIMEFLHLEK
jgi:hypothetical protein